MSEPESEPEPEAELDRREADGALREDEELPVVARMVVEIRSDGSRTVARGALEDRVSGQNVGVEAEAGSPLELSRALAKMLFSAPAMARNLIRGSADESTSPDEAVDEAPRSMVGRLRRRVREEIGERVNRELMRRLGVDDELD